MIRPPQNDWKYLALNPKSYLRQLFVKGTDFPARDLYALAVDPEEPRTLEEVAAAFAVPVEAVQEAIAYCRSEPAEMHQDFQDQETLVLGSRVPPVEFSSEEA